MRELDYKEGWVRKNWCFQIVVLERPLRVLQRTGKSKQTILKEIFIGRTDAEDKAPILWPPDEQSWLTGKDPEAGKDWGQEEKWAAEDETVEWHHWLNEHESEQTLGDSEGQGSLVCLSSQSRNELDMTSDWTRTIIIFRIREVTTIKLQKYQKWTFLGSEN